MEELSLWLHWNKTQSTCSFSFKARKPKLTKHRNQSKTLSSHKPSGWATPKTRDWQFTPNALARPRCRSKEQSDLRDACRVMSSVGMEAHHATQEQEIGKCNSHTTTGRNEEYVLSLTLVLGTRWNFALSSLWKQTWLQIPNAIYRKQGYCGLCRSSLILCLKGLIINLTVNDCVLLIYKQWGQSSHNLLSHLLKQLACLHRCDWRIL